MRADERRPAVFLQGGGEKLRRGDALVVDQHRDGQVDHLIVRGINGLAAILGAQGHDRALGQQRVERLAHLLDAAAAIVPHVNDQRLRAVRKQAVQHLLELRRHAVMEVLNAQIPHAAVQHLAPRHLLRDDCAFHGQLAHLVRPVLLHGNRHFGAGFALDRVNHRVRTVRGNGQPLGARDIVALLDTGPSRG